MPAHPSRRVDPPPASTGPVTTMQLPSWTPTVSHQALYLRAQRRGLRALVKPLQCAEVDTVGIERPDGPVVDALLEAGFTVFVTTANQLKNLRSRYGSAGNKDDHFDAYVLADTMRTDRHRLTALTQDFAPSASGG
jgi:hypothetical protein